MAAQPYYKHDNYGWFTESSPYPVPNATYKEPIPEDQLQEGERNRLVDGEWEAQVYAEPVVPEPVPENKVYLHLTITDPDLSAPNDIVNNGTDFIKIAYALRMSDDPTSEMAPIPDDSYSVVLKNRDNEDYDIIRIPFVGGAGLIEYSSTGTPAIIHLDTSSIAIPDNDAEIVLVDEGQYTIKIISKDFGAA